MPPMIRLKTPRQIDAIRRSAHLLVEVLDELEGIVEPGMTTADLDRAARRLIGDGGGVPSFLGYRGFPGALCTSINQEVIHGIPSSERVLKDGDVVSIDCGINLDGYFSDSAVTVAVGRIDPAVRRLMDVTLEALERGVEAAVVGNRVNDIAGAVFRTVKPHGYGIVRPYCGHGVGFDVHEDPQVPNYIGRGPNPRLKAGMVLAIEPMVNMGGDDVEVLDDEWTVVTADAGVSAHFEHMVAIFPDHTEVLTRRRTENGILQVQEA